MLTGADSKLEHAGGAKGIAATAPVLKLGETRHVLLDHLEVRVGVEDEAARRGARVRSSGAQCSLTSVTIVGERFDGVDLEGLSLSGGEGRHLDAEVAPEGLELGGRGLRARTAAETPAKLDISRSASGFAMRIASRARPSAPACAASPRPGVPSSVEAREVDHPGPRTRSCGAPTSTRECSTSRHGRTTRSPWRCRRSCSAAPSAPASVRSAVSRSTMPTRPTTSTTPAATRAGRSCASSKLD